MTRNSSHSRREHCAPRDREVHSAKKHHHRDDVMVPDQESGWTDMSSSPILSSTRHVTVDVDKLSNHPKKNGSTSRTSRVISWWIGLFVLAGAVVGLVFFINRKGYGTRTNSRHENYQGMVSASMLQTHNDPDTDCWMEIHGLVYDLTDYAPRHPGGPEWVTDYCGMNATKFYDAEHPTRYLPTIERYNVGAAVTDDEYSKAVTSQEIGAGTSTSATTVSPPAQYDTDSSSSSDEDDDDSDEEDNTGGNTTPRTPRTPVQPATEEAQPDDQNAVDAGTTSAPTFAPTVPQGCPVQYYNLATVQQHNTRGDCWYILYDRVYDFTTYVDEHPGGARYVFQYCGTDATIPYAQERKHNLNLLDKETPELWIGMWGDSTEVRYVDC